MSNWKIQLTRFLEWGAVISTLLLVGSVSIQIFARFALENTPSWTEEASRFFFIYIIGFSSGLALRDGYFVSMDIVYKGLKTRTKKIADLFSQVLTIAMFAVISIYAVQFIIVGLGETSPSLGIRMSFAFISILVMTLSLSFYAIDGFVIYLKDNK